MPVLNISDQLQRDEGFRGKPYRDTVGKVTIGFGRNLDDVGISADEASLMLANDIRIATMRLQSRFAWVSSLDDARRGVLINMAFNMGIDGLATFTTMLLYVQTGDYASASQAMLRSKWAGQVGDRAVRLSKQMATGEWQ